MKLFVGEKEIPIETDTEKLLVSALKAVLAHHGSEGWLKRVTAEFELNCGAFNDAYSFIEGDLQICTDANNRRDLVRLIR